MRRVVCRPKTEAREVKALELKNVEKSFKKRRGEVVRALDSVSLAVRKGEVVGILGPNGSGKSTLVRVVSTLVVPDAGSLEVFGVDAVKHPKTVQRSMNRVSVEASFFKKLSAMENLLYGAKLYGVTSAEARPRIAEILENIGFASKRAREPMEHLSRGMQQKVALARALLTSPILMLLDEPTTGLDPRSKKDVQEFIRRITPQSCSAPTTWTRPRSSATASASWWTARSWPSKSQRTSSAATRVTAKSRPWRRRSWPRPDTPSRRHRRKEKTNAQRTQAPVALGTGGRLGLRTTELLFDQALPDVGDRLARLRHGERHGDHLHRRGRRGRGRDRGHQVPDDLPARRRPALELPLDALRRTLRDGELGAVGG